MKYCIIMQDIFTLGGIQKVVELYSNNLVKQNNEVTIIMPFDVEPSKRNLVKLDDTINLINYREFSKRTYISRLKNKIISINNNYNILEKFVSIKFLDNFIHSKKTKSKLINFINSNNFDVVIAAGGEIWSNLLGSIAENINSITVGWQHCTFDGYFMNKGKANYGIKKLCYNNYKKLDQIWVLTSKDKQKFDDYFKISSIVCPNPILLQKCRSNLNNKNVLFLGRIKKEVKGLNYLVEIIKRTINLDNSIFFDIVGDGSDKKWLIEKVNEYNLTNNVRFHETTNNVYEYYLNSSLLIQTSTYEGFGMTIIEAMSCGVPAIAFHNDGPDEIIENDENGYLIDKYNINEFSNKIVSLLSDSSKIKHLGDDAYNTANKYDINIFINRTTELIENLIKQKK